MQLTPKQKVKRAAAVQEPWNHKQEACMHGCTGYLALILHSSSLYIFTILHNDTTIYANAKISQKIDAIWSMVDYIYDSGRALHLLLVIFVMRSENGKVKPLQVDDQFKT
jgi:hypothetical protein